MKHANLSQKLTNLFIIFFIFIGGRLLAQVPIAYYDFELNSDRNTTVETTVQEIISGVGSPLFSVSSLTASHGSGNGTSATYGGSNAGYAIGYYGFTTNATSSATDPYIQLGPFNCSGFSTLFVTADIVGIGTKMPANIDLYYSTNNITYTRIATTTSVTTDYTGISFTLPAAVNGTSSLYLRLVAFNAGVSPSATDGVLRIDNLTLSARVITASKTLINTSLHGEGLSSGGTYLPAYTQLNINGAGITVIPQGELLLGTMAGTQGLILTDGILDVSDKTLSFQISNAPIARNGTSQVGTITTNNNTIINFGNATNLGGNAFTIPANCFTNNPAVVNSINVNRTNLLALGNPFLIDGGTLNLISGRVDIGANSLGFQNGNTPISRTTGTLNAIGTSVVYFGTSGNTGGAAFTIPDGTFTNSPESFENITIQRTNPLSLGNQGIIINGTLHLESGVFNLGANNITFQNSDLPITRNTGTLSVSSSTNLIFGTSGNKGGAAFTIPDDLFSSAFIVNNFTINRNNELQLGNQNLTINGSLTLTDGVLNINGRGLIFQNGNSPILRNGTGQIGTISTNNFSSITFGTTGNTGGSAFTIPANVFTNTPYTVQNFTVNRTNALTLNTQGLIVDGGSLTLTLGALVVGASTLTLQNTNTPIARTDGTLTVSTSSNISFGSMGNTAGNAYTIPNDVFTSTPILNNFTVYRTNSLTIGNQGLTINGTLFLEQGELAIAGNTLTFRNNDVPISRTSGTITTISSSNIIFGTAGNTGGAVFTLPNGLFTSTPTLNSLTVNRTNNLTLGDQSLTLTGNLVLTLGTLNDNGNVITVQGNVTGTGKHIRTSSGKIVMNGSGGASISGITTDYIELNNAAGFSLSGGLIINGTLELTNGTLVIGANTLTFRNGDTPILRSSGTITGGITSNLVFGTVGNTGGAAFTIPSGTFGSANLFRNVSVNRDNSLSITNVGLSVNGTLTLTSGELIIGSSTLLFQNANTPISRTSGTITSSVNSSLQFGSTGNLGGSAFILPDNVFTNNPSVYNNVTIQRTNALTLGNQSIVVDGGTLNLVNGVFAIGANNTLTFQNGNTPISRTSGTITVTTTSNIAFGSTGNTGGAAFTIPNGVFTASSPSLNNFTVNRTNSLTLGNQGITINGTLELTLGVLSVGSNTLTFQNGNTPISRTSGTLTVSTGTNLVFGTAGNTGGNAFTLPNSLFTSAPVSINNFTINRTNKLTIGNQAFVINGTITLTLGEVDFLNTTLTFQNGNTPISRISGSITLGSSGSLVFGTAGNTGGSSHTIPANAFTNNPLVITNFTVNRTNALTLGQSLTVDGGTLTLTLGALNVGANNTLTFQNTNTPLSRTSGSITVTTTSNIAFGSTGNTGGAAFTIPDNIFTATSPSLGSFIVNRINDLNLGNQALTINGTLNLVAGNFNVGSHNLIFQNGDVPMARTSGTLITSGSPSYTFGTPGNTGGAAFIIPNDFFSTNPVNFSNITINRTNALTLGNQTFQISGTLTLTLGEINIGNAGLTFHTSNTPIARNGTSQTGTIGGSSTGNITFGITGNTGGNPFTIPNNTFTSSPIEVNNFTINRINTLTHNNQSLTVNGTLNLVLGTYSFGNNTLTFQNGNTPMSRTNGTITLGSSANLIFGTAGNTGGSAFTIPANIFTSAPSISSFSINRTNSLTLNNQNLTLSGNLNLIGGVLNDAGRTITVNGNITGTATHEGSGIIVMPSSGSTISGATLANLQLNNAGGFSLTGSPTITAILTLTSGALSVGSHTLTFHTSNTPIVRTSGTLNVSTSSGLRFGTAAHMGGNDFTLPNDLFSSTPDFAFFAVNRTNSLTLNNQNFTLRRLLSLEAGMLILPSNYLFTLKSTSITNTALVGTMGNTASIFYNSGASFRVERFIPQMGGTGRRAFRDLAPSVNSGSRTIFELWQENGTNGFDDGVYYGTHITGRAGASPGGVHAATGFDITQSGAGSLNTFDINTLTGVGAWKTWTSANASTNQTNDTLSAFKGYRITIRGNRLVNLYQNPQPTGMNDIAILRSRGKLVTGNVVFNTSGVTANGATNTNIRLSGTAGGFTMIGNPYACAVDWDLLYTDASTSNISSTYFLFDPNVGTSGGYATYNQTTGISVPGASAINKFIQPGQAIFIQNTGTSPSITFKETHKVADVSALTNTFRTARTESAISRLLIDLNRNVSGSFVNMDGVAVAFNNAYDNGEGPEDASKISNAADNLAVLRSSKQWAIEGRKEPTINDTVRLRLWAVTAGTTYQLSINTKHFQQINLQPYLYDYFTNTELKIPLNTSYVYNFSVTSNTASFNERFIITFKASLSLPTTFLDFTVKRINAEKVNLQWQTKFYNLKLFEIERSTDGVNFYQIAVVTINTPASTVSGFNYVDETANGKMLYYRIKAVDKDNSYTYSKILSTKQDVLGIELLNNFIINDELKLRVDNSVNQQLSVKIIDIMGRVLFKSNVNTEFNNIITVPIVSLHLNSGFYFVVVNNQDATPYIFKFFKQ